MLEDFGHYVIKKAISKLEFYRFHNLKSFLPNVKSIHEFISSDRYLKKIRVEVEGEEGHVESLTPDEKLKITVSILDKVSQSLESDKVEYQGTPEFLPHNVSKIFKDKTLNIFVKEGSDQEYGVPQSQASNNALRLDLSGKEWYAFKENYGTSEEKYLIKFIDKTYDALKSKWGEIFLVRNERHFQIYNFDDGQPIEPDFVLFLKKKDSDLSIHYQVFIEPKGEHLLKHDEWKEKFLKSLKEKHRIIVLWKSKKYIVWGMPFYNEALKKTEFENEFKASLLDK
jgi:type III restriction enzyme